MIIAVLALALGVAACGDDDDGGDNGDSTEAATDVTPANLTLAYVTTEQHPYGRAVNNFIETVDANSGGAIKITGQPSFPGDIPLLADVRSGTVEMATVSSAVWDNAGVNAFQALQAPFLITNYEIERKVLSSDDGTGLGDIAEDMLARLEEEDDQLKGLAIHEGGLRSPLGREKPLVSLADFDDGTVDGMEANTGLVNGFKYYEVADFFTGNVVFWPFPTVMVMNKAAWDGLDDTQREIIEDAAAATPGFIIDQLSGGSDPFAQNLANCGLEFVEASAEDKAALEEAGKTAISALGDADPTTGDFITRIEEVKEGVGSTDAPVVTATKEDGAECDAG